jgi:predicted alpha-1,2-mannosidase
MKSLTFKSVFACGVNIMLLFGWSNLAAANGKSPVAYVDPMIGATTTGDAAGKTFPGVATPFGMVQLSPDTVTGGDNGSGYSSDMSTIEGFSFTHMSGVGWYGEFGNMQVMPEVGDLITDRDSAKSHYDKSSEITRCGYYSVFLDRYHVRTELTATPHSGIMRLTFPAASVSRIKFDITRRIGGDGSHSTSDFVQRVNNNAYEGWIKCDPSGGGWGDGAGGVRYTLYFSLQTSVPFKRTGIWDGSRVAYSLSRQTGSRSGFFLEFPTTNRQIVLLKSGISFVSIDGARANLASEIPGWNFDGTERSCRRLWSTALNGVTVTGGSEAQKTVFYRALYHSLLDPRSVSDLDGKYTAPNGNPQNEGGWTARTCFSGWDVYRAEFPLLELIEPDVVNDEVNTLLQIHNQSGQPGLPRWELMGRDTNCMVGDPSLAIISDAYLKGIRSYDSRAAFKMCYTDAVGPSDQSNRNDLQNWITKGCCVTGASISETFENSYDDYALARFASSLGKSEDADKLYKSCLNYKNVFDPDVGWFRGRDSNGGWLPWTGRLTSGGCVESNPEQQGRFVPQDVAGLIKLIGGKEEFNHQLNDLFDHTSPGLIKTFNDWYNQSNEPVQQCPFMFVYSGAPWLTQHWSRFVSDNAYGLGPTGWCGNDDVGQMSAWYVFAAAGLYPMSPASNIYIIGSPIFDKAAFKTGDRHEHKFTIIANQNSAVNEYVQSARLDGKPLSRSWLTYAEITHANKLELIMGPNPNKLWGSDENELPPTIDAEKDTND